MSDGLWALNSDMTRITSLKPHFTDSELKERYWRATSPIEARRWHLLWLVSQKKTIKQAAKIIGFNYDYAKDIIKFYNQQGEPGIVNKLKQEKKRPSHAILNKQELEELREALKKEPQDQGIWTGPKVANWIAQKTGKEKIWPQRGWDYLKKCRYSPQKPRPSHKKGDKIEQEELKKNSI